MSLLSPTTIPISVHTHGPEGKGRVGEPECEDRACLQASRPAWQAR